MIQYPKKKSFIDYVVIFILLISISSTSTLCYNIFYLILSLIFIASIAIFRKKLLSKYIWLIVLYFVLIDITATIYIHGNYNINRLFNYLYPVLLGYFTITALGQKTFSLLEKVIYILSCISLPLYVLQIVNLSFIESFSSIFGGFVAEPLRYGNSWYAFIFSYCDPRVDLGYTRNSGFMWEPGAFSFVLIVFLVYRLMQNGFSLRDSHVIIYLMALITTFSTSGYIALFFIIIAYAFLSKSALTKMIVVLLMVLFVPILYNAEFMSGKISEYIENTKAFSYSEHEDATIEFNRYLYFWYVLEQLFRFPLGYGSHDVMLNNSKVVSPNGLAEFIYHWGIIGFVAVFGLVYKFIKKINSKLLHIKPLICILLACAIFSVTFSNPVDNNILFYLILLFPMHNKISCI